MLAVAAGTLAGGALSLVHAFFTVALRSNQVLSGLALTILGTGLANFLGRPLIGQTGVRIRQLPIPYLSDIPVMGEVFFNQSPFAYAAYLLVPLAWFVLFRTRAGLVLRAVGEDAAISRCGRCQCGAYAYPLHLCRRLFSLVLPVPTCHFLILRAGKKP